MSQVEFLYSISRNDSVLRIPVFYLTQPQLDKGRPDGMIGSTLCARRHIGGASEIFALIPYSWANLGLNSVKLNNVNNNKAW